MNPSLPIIAILVALISSCLCVEGEGPQSNGGSQSNGGQQSKDEKLTEKVAASVKQGATKVIEKAASTVAAEKPVNPESHQPNQKTVQLNVGMNVGGMARDGLGVLGSFISKGAKLTKDVGGVIRESIHRGATRIAESTRSNQPESNSKDSPVKKSPAKDSGEANSSKSKESPPQKDAKASLGESKESLPRKDAKASSEESNKSDV